MSISRPEEMNWKAGELPGLFLKVLFDDLQRGYRTALVRMTAGTHYPPHRHAGVEELYLMEGDLSVDEFSIRPGDYCRGEAGSIHGEIFTNTGCLFLVSSSHQDEILAQSAFLHSSGRKTPYLPLAQIAPLPDLSDDRPNTNISGGN